MGNSRIDPPGSSRSLKVSLSLYAESVEYRFAYPRRQDMMPGCTAIFSTTHESRPGQTSISFSLVDFDLGRIHRLGLLGGKIALRARQAALQGRHTTLERSHPLTKQTKRLTRLLGLLSDIRHHHSRIVRLIEVYAARSMHMVRGQCVEKASTS